MATAMNRPEIEKYVLEVVESRLSRALEEYIERNEVRIKELALMERVIRVEEELKALRQMSETRFETMDERFEALQREMNARFEAVDKRFEALQREMNARFEALQREMNVRFEAMDKRFSAVQWMIGILVGIPALAIAITQIIKIL
jgi:exonuclease VII large subunit